MWLTAGEEARRSDRIVQGYPAGPVQITRDSDNHPALQTPSVVHSGPVGGPLVERPALILKLDRGQIFDARWDRWANNGPGWVAVPLKDANTVPALEPDFDPDYSAECGLGVGPVSLPRRLGVRL